MAAAVIGRAAVGAGLRGARRRQTMGLLRRGCAGLAVDDTVNGLSEEQRQVRARPRRGAAAALERDGGSGARPRALAAHSPVPPRRGCGGVAGCDWPPPWGAGLSPGAQRGRGAAHGGRGAPRTRVRRGRREPSAERRGATAPGPRQKAWSGFSSTGEGASPR